MFELLVLVVPSDKKDLCLVFINEQIFPKLVRGPLFLSTTFRTVTLDRLPSNIHFIQQIKHSKRKGSDICTYFLFFQSAYTFIICETNL